jgi:YD repeat-containing protein
LDNLIRVRQGGFPTGNDPNPIVQFRSFYYDSLSRLLYANNPEQDATLTCAAPCPAALRWTMKYEYDLNGNLEKRTDARGVLTTYYYDNINRNYRVTYSNGTAEVRRYFDTATNGLGRLQRVESDNIDPRPNSGVAYSRTIINGYDALGRAVSQTQRFGRGNAASPTWNDYTVTRGTVTFPSYDLAGHLLGQTYPSGRGVDYNYNDGGRMTSFGGSLGDGAYRSYSLEMKYNEAGLMRRETFGTSQFTLYHGMVYNKRHQMVETSVGSEQTNDRTWTRGSCGSFTIRAMIHWRREQRIMATW